jgi:hypothetical protein
VDEYTDYIDNDSARDDVKLATSALSNTPQSDDQSQKYKSRKLQVRFCAFREHPSTISFCKQSGSRNEPSKVRSPAKLKLFETRPIRLPLKAKVEQGSDSGTSLQPDMAR